MNTLLRSVEDPVNKNFKLFNYTWQYIEANHIESKTLKRDEMIYGAIKGMVASVGDPFTAFLNPTEHRAFQESLTGVFEGVGIEVAKVDGNIQVEKVYEDSAGSRAGLKKGDRIISINHKIINSWSLSEMKSIINGKKGTKINLEVYSDLNSDFRELEIIQDEFIPPSVNYTVNNSMGNRIGIIQVTRFGEQTIDEWKRLVPEIEDVNGIVIDLRNNLGGFTEVPLYIASEFIEYGGIYKEINNKGVEKTFSVNHKGNFLKIPVIVLINKKSVSATEMLAASMRYHKRAILVGEISFGKATEQTIYDLENGSGLHITTSKWLIPDGSSVDHVGLIPEYQIEVTKNDILNNQDPQLDFAIKLLD
jgi:carboxyl-terminal processing protease